MKKRVHEEANGEREAFLLRICEEYERSHLGKEALIAQ